MSMDAFDVMVVTGEMSTLDCGTTEAASPLRLLVVGANQRWTRVVASAAARLGGAAVVDTASNSRSALSRILTASQPYSLVLLQPSRVDTAVEDLADLTSGDAGSGTGLLLLGDSPRHPPGSIVVEHPNRAAISLALSRHPWNVEGVTPKLTMAEMLAALHGPMLKLRYQPVIQLADQKPTGLEVLARLDHAELGMLSGDQFIPQMEAAGLSRLLTETVITRAMEDACRHGLIRLGLRIGLNVPLNVLLMADIFEFLDTKRRQFAIPAAQIAIELTETQPVKDLEALRDAVRRLRAVGYRVCIDDASPAMPNIGALLEMAFTTVKFDKSVVRRAKFDPTSREFVEQTTRIAKAADIQSIAEGIEDIETQDLMQALGLESAQGFLIARPLPAAAVKVWLNTWQQSEG